MTGLDFGDRKRARQLFTRLEEAFAGFIQPLPTGVKELAQQRGTYHGDLDKAPFGGLGVLNPVLVGTPWLFWDSFEGLCDETFLKIAEAGAFYVLASVVLDHLVDNQVSEPAILTIYHQFLYSQGVARYRTAFPTLSPFWSHFYRLETSHLNGLATEISLQSLPADFTSQSLATIAHGKVSPIITTLIALCVASGHPQYIPSLEASLNHIAVASQNLDDIGDWQVDLQDHHITYFLVELAGPNAWAQDQSPTEEMLAARLQSEWTDVTHLKQVMQGLDQALEVVQGMQCPDWVRYVESYRTLTDEHLNRAIKLHVGQVFSRMG